MISDGAIVELGSSLGGNVRFIDDSSGGLVFGNGSGVVYYGAISGDGAVGVDGPGTLTLDNTDNDYSGGTGLQRWHSRVAAQDGVLPDGGNVHMEGPGTLDLNGYNQTVGELDNGNDIQLGSGTLTIGGGNIEGVISGPGALVMDGPGTLVLDGANTYTGGTSIEGGVLSIDNDHELGIGGGVTLDGGTLQTNAAITSDRVVTVGALGGTLDTDDFAVTFDGPVSGSGPLAVTDSSGFGVGA